MMDNIYITASPFQLISAIEARNRLKSARNTFVIFLSENSLQVSFLKKIEEMFIEGDDVIYVDYISKRNSVAAKMNLLKTLKYKHFDNIFIGHFAEFFMQLYICNLDYKNIFLLDDGTATLVYDKKLTEKVTYVQCDKKLEIKNLIKHLLILRHGFVIEKKVEINWFTMFDFNPNNGNTYIRHNFEFLKSKYLNSDAGVAHHKLYFIGPGLVRDGIVKSNEIYVELIKKIRARYSHFEFIYLPHRFEHEDDLKALTEDTDIQIVRFDNVLEVAFIAHDIVPRHICSFYSTALYSLKLLYPECEVDFMELDKSYVNDQFIDVVTHVEVYYKNLFNSICDVSE